MTRTRPRNRKAQLADAAAELFRKHGYHQVSVNDIAAAAGVTGPAVYRHFRGKQDILAHVLLSGMDMFGLVTEEALAAAGHPGRAARRAAARGRGAGRRPARGHRAVALGGPAPGPGRPDQDPPPQRRADGQWGIALRDARPDLSKADAELLCWAALSVFGSVSVHHVSLPRRRFEAVLAELAGAVLAWLPPERTATAPAPPRPAPLTPPTRREELLSAATKLFRDRGFHAVSMEDIGAAAGIAGPSIYRYFPGKSAILVAAGYRMADRLARTADTAVGDAAGPRDALARLASSYVDTVLRVGQPDGHVRGRARATCPTRTARSWSGCSEPMWRSGSGCSARWPPTCPSRRRGSPSTPR